MNNILTCPVCKCELYEDAKMYRCKNNHVYDKAKEGYVNLLLANQKNSKQPGDNKLMLDARRQFLDSDAYKPLLNNIINLLGTHIKKNSCIVEAGCGEGYYISNIKKVFPKSDTYGLDISKDAVKMASKRYTDVKFLVASSYDTNIKDKSVDALIVVFAPFAEVEFNRILCDDGIVVVVKPGANHLLEFKEKLYKQIKHNSTNSLKNFEVVNAINVKYTLNPTKEQSENLLKMTPFYYQNIQKMQKIDDFSAKNGIKIEFLVEVLKKI